MSVEQIDRYEVLAEIGHGGMATVYRARAPEGEDVAIKVLRREFLTDLGFRARFEREAQTIASLEHPAIVPLLAHGQHEGQLYLVMPYMPGGSLALRLHQGTLSPQATGTILARVADALDSVHARGIVHRDLKPSNILFDADDRAYLADFGIALETMAEGNSRAITGGTPTYMSPEQCQPGADIDGRSDVYSLGVTLFQMLTGRPPFEGDTPLAILAQHVLQSPPALRNLKPDLPLSLEPVVMKALAKEADARYPTAGALSAAYQQALGEPDAESAAPVAPGDTGTLVVNERAVEPAGATSSIPPEDAGGWSLLQARASRLIGDARRWLSGHFVVAQVLVSLLAILCAAATVMAIRGPDVLQAWSATLFGSPTRVVFVPLVISERSVEKEATPTPEPTRVQAGNLLLLYTAEGVTVINVSDEAISLSGLTFRREATEGSGAALFAADEWRRVAGRAVADLRPADCLQLLHLRGASANPQEIPPCDSLRGWLATGREERLFFLPTADVGAFEVRRGEQLVGRCVIGDGECRLSIPRP